MLVVNLQSSTVCRVGLMKEGIEGGGGWLFFQPSKIQLAGVSQRGGGALIPPKSREQIHQCAWELSQMSSKSEDTLTYEKLCMKFSLRGRRWRGGGGESPPQCYCITIMRAAVAALSPSAHQIWPFPSENRFYKLDTFSMVSQRRGGGGHLPARLHLTCAGRSKSHLSSGFPVEKLDGESQGWWRGAVEEKESFEVSQCHRIQNGKGP